MGRKYCCPLVHLHSSFSSSHFCSPTHTPIIWLSIHPYGSRCIPFSLSPSLSHTHAYAISVICAARYFRRVWHTVAMTKMLQLPQMFSLFTILSMVTIGYQVDFGLQMHRLWCLHWFSNSFRKQGNTVSMSDTVQENEWMNDRMVAWGRVHVVVFCSMPALSCSPATCSFHVFSITLSKCHITGIW